MANPMMPGQTNAGPTNSITGASNAGIGDASNVGGLQNAGYTLQMLVNAAQANTQLLGAIQQVLGNSYIALSGNNVFTGNNTFQGTSAFTGAGTFSAPNVFSALNTFSAGLRFPPRVVTAAGVVTVTAADFIVTINKTVGAATTVNLPAGIAGMTFWIKDGKGDAAANNITITPAAGNIDGAGTMVVSTNYGFRLVNYNGTEWNRLV